jgi:hypothetical protein
MDFGQVGFEGGQILTALKTPIPQEAAGRKRASRSEAPRNLGVQPLFQILDPTARPVHFPTMLHCSIDKTILD